MALCSSGKRAVKIKVKPCQAKEEVRHAEQQRMLECFVTRSKDLESGVENIAMPDQASMDFQTCEDCMKRQTGKYDSSRKCDACSKIVPESGDAFYTILRERCQSVQQAVVPEAVVSNQPHAQRSRRTSRAPRGCKSLLAAQNMQKHQAPGGVDSCRFSAGLQKQLSACRVTAFDTALKIAI